MESSGIEKQVERGNNLRFQGKAIAFQINLIVFYFSTYESESKICRLFRYL